MRMRIARIAKRLHNKFRGLYWRQMFVTVGMVLLTLFLLGASFFSLSYSYARGQEDDELAAQARVVGQLSVSYLENGRYLDMEELQHEQDFQNLASFAATVSEVDFLICDVEGHVLLSTDAALQRPGGDHAGGYDSGGAGEGDHLQPHGSGRPLCQQAVRGGCPGA